MRIARAQQLHKHAALQACLRARGQLRLRRLRDNVKQQQGHVLSGAEGSCVQCCEALHIAPQRHNLADGVRPHLADARGQVCAQDSRLWQRRTMRCTVLLQLHTQASCGWITFALRLWTGKEARAKAWLTTIVCATVWHAC